MSGRSSRRCLACAVALAIGMVCSMAAAHPPEDLERLSRSEVWQVRYCIPMELKVPTPEAREILERLAADEHRGVARQAFARYTRLFVDVDPALAKRAFERGDFDLVGIQLPSRKAFETAEFWRGQVNHDKEDSIKARSVRAVGLLADPAALADLEPLLKTSTNVYLLSELALAGRRLGNDDLYLAALRSILDQAPTKTLYYQTLAIEYLAQTHPDQAIPSWDRLNAALTNPDTLQPNWLYAHVLQGERLTKGKK